MTTGGVIKGKEEAFGGDKYIYIDLYIFLIILITVIFFECIHMSKYLKLYILSCEVYFMPVI